MGYLVPGNPWVTSGSTTKTVGLFHAVPGEDPGPRWATQTAAQRGPGSGSGTVQEWDPVIETLWPASLRTHPLPQPDTRR